MQGALCWSSVTSGVALRYIEPSGVGSISSLQTKVSFRTVPQATVKMLPLSHQQFYCSLSRSISFPQLRQEARMNPQLDHMAYDVVSPFGTTLLILLEWPPQQPQNRGSSFDEDMRRRGQHPSNNPYYYGMLPLDVHEISKFRAQLQLSCDRFTSAFTPHTRF